LDLYSAFHETQGRFTKKNRGKTNITKTKGSQTTSQTDKTTNRLGAKGLSKQMGLEGPFEGAKRGDIADLRGESVPEGGGCYTEGSVPEVSQFGAGGGKQARV